MEKTQASGTRYRVHAEGGGDSALSLEAYGSMLNI